LVGAGCSDAMGGGGPGGAVACTCSCWPEADLERARGCCTTIAVGIGGLSTFVCSAACVIGELPVDSFEVRLRGGEWLRLARVPPTPGATTRIPPQPRLGPGPALLLAAAACGWCCITVRGGWGEAEAVRIGKEGEDWGSRDGGCPGGAAAERPPAAGLQAPQAVLQLALQQVLGPQCTERCAGGGG